MLAGSNPGHARTDSPINDRQRKDEHKCSGDEYGRTLGRIDRKRRLTQHIGDRGDMGDKRQGEKTPAIAEFPRSKAPRARPTRMTRRTTQPRCRWPQRRCSNPGTSIVDPIGESKGRPARNQVRSPAVLPVGGAQHICLLDPSSSSLHSSPRSCEQRRTKELIGSR